MKPVIRRVLTLVWTVSALVPLAACGVDVQESGPGKNVDIRSPLGDLSVRTDLKNVDTGLPVYPGAQPLRDDDDPENANVNISSRWFGVKVIAAKYESRDTQERILDFYRREMKVHGPVTECRGDVDFRGGPGSRRVVCKERPSSSDVQLVTGTEERQRVVAVKPRGTGTEFSLVYVATRS
jgi:hypothetical protein